MLKVKVTAPGRVNLIGEHTDYNSGWVMPAAIELTMEIEAALREDRIITAAAPPLYRREVFSLEKLSLPCQQPAWIDYIKAVCWALREAGYPVPGADLKISSSLPIGAGLSSSAALEVGVAAALSALAGTQIPRLEMALLCQKAENDFVGVRCGIMDQMAVALGKSGHALLIDCRSLDYSYIPLPLGNHRLLIVDSRIGRSLGSSAYNRRRLECEEAVQQIAQKLGRPLDSLREVGSEDLKQVEGLLQDTLYRRSRYVVEENERVQHSARALQIGDLPAFGQLMNLSHDGLRDLYQVSCPELDLIADTARAQPGVLGARMTGAGFGGCAVVLLEQSLLAQARARLTEAFLAEGLQEPLFYLTAAGAGVSVQPLQQ